MKSKTIRILLTTVFSLLLVGSSTITATTIDFEDLPDLTLVNDFYALQGVYFNEAISLTAGFSLNEIDFPPSSGIMAIGDDFGPMEILFDNPVENLFANFTYGTQLTFSAYDVNHSLLGTFVNPGLGNYGYSQIVSLNFTGISKLIVAGDPSGASFIMDDLNYTNTIPEPATILMLGFGLLSITGFARKM